MVKKRACGEGVSVPGMISFWFGWEGNLVGQIALSEILVFGAKRLLSHSFLWSPLTLLRLATPLSRVCAGQHLIAPLHQGCLG